MIEARSRFKRTFGQDMEAQFVQESGRGTVSTTPCWAMI